MSTVCDHKTVYSALMIDRSNGAGFCATQTRISTSACSNVQFRMHSHRQPNLAESARRKASHVTMTSYPVSARAWVWRRCQGNRTAWRATDSASATSRSLVACWATVFGGRPATQGIGDRREATTSRWGGRGGYPDRRRWTGNDRWTWPTTEISLPAPLTVPDHPSAAVASSAVRCDACHVTSACSHVVSAGCGVDSARDWTSARAPVGVARQRGCFAGASAWCDYDSTERIVATRRTVAQPRDS